MSAELVVAQGPQHHAELQVTVLDPSGAVIVGASVELLESGEILRAADTDARGQVEFDNLASGARTLFVSSPGFEPHVDPTVRIVPGPNQEHVTLQVARFTEEVDVAVDPRQAALDREGDTFGVTFTGDDLDALPDSEEELRQVLMELAGPGADLTVDGFQDSELPPPSQIQEIRIQRTLYSADRRGGGRARVRVVTRPGVEAWRGTVRLGYRNGALNARNAFSPVQMPEEHVRLSGSVQGPLVRDRTSLSMNVDLTSSYQAQTIRATGVSGLISDIVRQPDDRISATVGLQHALSPLHTVRVQYQQGSRERENVGVGDFDLHERGYTNETDDRRLRLSSTAVIGSRLRHEARLQAQWDERWRTPVSEDVTVRVLDALTFGGANVRGGRRERSVDLDQMLEARWGRHSLSVGGQFAWMRFSSDEIRNADGTFTFSTLQDFDAGRPRSFSVRLGNPEVEYGMFQGSVFSQADLRLGEGLSLGLGLRQAWQSHLSDRRNLLPRAGVAWTPGRDGRLVIRGGAGVFNDWYGASTYEETLQVDGVRLQDVVVNAPGYPDPLAGGDFVILPNGRVQAASELAMPLMRRATIAVERRIGEAVRANVSYTVGDGLNELRGRNVNAPDERGVRPDPEIGNVVEIRSIGTSREHEVSMGANARLPWRSLFVTARYGWARAFDDGSGPTALPADNSRPDEWGPASGDVRHRLSIFTGFRPVESVQVGLSARAESAPPYTITTGTDDNGDAVFNDRPPGAGRNSARGAGFVRFDMRLAWRPAFGAFGGMEGGPVRGQRGTGQGRAGGRSEPRVTTEVYLDVTNLLNNVAPSRFSGVLTSPFFGQVTAARPARRIELGTRVRF